jgi:hypothetical protein
VKAFVMTRHDDRIAVLVPSQKDEWGKRGARVQRLL